MAKGAQFLFALISLSSCTKKNTSLRSQLQAFFGKENIHVKKIGNEYRKQARELNTSSLFARIQPQMSVSEIELLIEESIKNDFAAEDTITLYNWSFAKTEAEICALYASASA